MTKRRAEDGPGDAQSDAQSDGRSDGQSEAPSGGRKRSPDAVFGLAADGAVRALNDSAANLMASVESGGAPELAAALDRLRGERRLTFESVRVEGGDGVRVIELTFLPATEGDAHLLCHETTLERNLRSVLAESRQRYKDLVEISSDFAWETGANGAFVFVSPRGALGYTAEELVGRRAESFLVASPDEPGASPFGARSPRDRVQVWFRRADGGTACLEATCAPLRDENGFWSGTRGVCRDVTQDRERDAALAGARNRERLHAYILHAIRDEVDPESMLDAAARAVAKALSADACQIYRLVGVPRHVPVAEYGAAVAPEMVAPILARLGGGDSPVEKNDEHWRASVVATRYRRAVTGALCLFRTKEAPHWSDEEREVIVNAADQVAIAIEQVAHHESLRRLSRTDALTGLLNRRAYFEEVSGRLDLAERRARAGALLYVDLDNFKLVNDRLGHQKGDEALRAVAGMLMDNARSGDLVARLGGDEFALWLDGADEAGAINKANELLAQAAALAESYDADERRPLGLSIGIAPYLPGASVNIEQLIGRADLAMYRAKRGGKGGYHIAARAPEAVA
ncbi:MAG: diguanylate cyclase [Alphaproteobacteria bacterium]